MVKPLPKTFGERVRYARRDVGMTQEQLADRSGLGQSAISSIETGQTHWSRGPNLLGLAGALDVDVRWLETGSGPMRSPHNPPDYAFADLLSALTPDNRRRLMGMGRALLADQLSNARASVADPYPTAPKPAPKSKKTTA